MHCLQRCGRLPHARDCKTTPEDVIQERRSTRVLERRIPWWNHCIKSDDIDLVADPMKKDCYFCGIHMNYTVEYVKYKNRYRPICVDCFNGDGPKGDIRNQFK